MNEKKEKSKLWLVLFFIFLIVVVLAAGILFRQYLNGRSANELLSGLQKDVNENTADSREAMNENSGQEEVNELTGDYTGDTSIAGKDNSPKAGISSETDIKSGSKKAKDDDTDAANLSEIQDIKIPGKNLDWDKLHEENSDIYAWIYVPDTTVDYPVLQHPTDNSYYLNHNVDGTKGYPGCIYTENFNSKDFSDIHTVLYGHNLKDKSMFSTLHNFENEELFNEDHYIFIYTEDSVFVYQIFAVYEFSAIHLLDNYDYTNEYVYEDYLKKIYQTTDRVANVRPDIQVTAADKIVTLSTCTEDHDSERRFLVTGVLVNP